MNDLNVAVLLESMKSIVAENEAYLATATDDEYTVVQRSLHSVGEYGSFSPMQEVAPNAFNFAAQRASRIAKMSYEAAEANRIYFSKQQFRNGGTKKATNLDWRVVTVRWILEDMMDGLKGSVAALEEVAGK